MNFDTLILTPWMSPHQVVPWYESICAFFTGKIDVLEEYEETVSSPSITLRIPAVARLRRNVSRVKRDVKFSRVNVYTRDDFRCQFCGEKKAARLLTYDHVLPFSKGGKTTWENIVTSCGPCNRRKGNRTPEQAGMRLLKRPVRPKTLPMAHPIALPREIPEAWRMYLMVPADVSAVGA